MAIETFIRFRLDLEGGFHILDLYLSLWGGDRDGRGFDGTSRKDKIYDDEHAHNSGFQLQPLEYISLRSFYISLSLIDSDGNNIQVFDLLIGKYYLW